MDEKPHSQTVTEYKHNIEAAHRTHDVEKEHGFRLNEAAINNASQVLRALILINGGAAVAVLAFISSLAHPLPKEITSSVWGFAGGVAVTAVAMCFAYFTNYCYTAASVALTRSYEHPYIQENEESHKWLHKGTVCHRVSILLSICAVASFVFGVIGVASVIDSLTLVPPT